MPSGQPAASRLPSGLNARAATGKLPSCQFRTSFFLLSQTSTDSVFVCYSAIRASKPKSAIDLQNKKISCEFQVHRPLLEVGGRNPNGSNLTLRSKEWS